MEGQFDNNDGGSRVYVSTTAKVILGRNLGFNLILKTGEASVQT